MIATAILGLIQSLLINGLILYTGKLLQNIPHLRAFLGLTQEEEDPANFAYTSLFIKQIGKLLVIISLFGMLVSVITTVTFLSRL